MLDRYSRMPPEEQKIVLFALLSSASVLWLALAWADPMLLLALPVVVFAAHKLVRRARRRADQQSEDWLS